MNDWRLKLMTRLLGLVALLSIGTSASASILLLEDSFVDVELMLADSGSGASSSAPAPNTDREPSDDDSDPNAPSELLSAFQMPPEGSTSGASSPTTGSGGTSSSAFDSAAVVSLSTPELVAWLGSEKRLTLPTPPGNDMLRPPQETR